MAGFVFPTGGNHHVYAASFARPAGPCRPLDVILCRVLAENDNHDGDARPGRKGNPHLRVCLRSQRKDQLGHSSAGKRFSGFTRFNSDVAQRPLVKGFNAHLVILIC
jgi:hypothetical protein